MIVLPRMRVRSGGLAILSIAIAAHAAAQAPPSSQPPPPAPTLSNDVLLKAYKQSIDDVSNGKYVEASFGMLRALGITRIEQTKDADVVDQWAQVMSTMTGTPTFNSTKGPDFHVPPEQVAELRTATGTPAIAEIVKRAKETRIVMLDENHLDPRGRAFGLEVARALRPLGYTVLAVETLKRGGDEAAVNERVTKLVADGYVRRTSGYYTDDPVFADFLRQALALGYRVIPYETSRPKFSQEEREQDQADNIVRRAVRASPDAKILIYGGEHHAAEAPIAVEGGKGVFMAERLKKATGIDPLTIDQGGLSPIPMNRPDVDLYEIAASKAARGDVVLMSHGRPLTTGLLAGSVDLQVVHPPVAMIDGRPDWLRGMGRKAVPVPDALRPATGTQLVQAFIATEADDAIPIDQVLVTAGAAVPMLMLPQKPVRYVVQRVK